MSDALKVKQSLPIGVFDSGMGGLTVLSELKRNLPNESYLYLGDTARLPYGTKSRHAVVQYAMQMVSILVARGIKLLVIACNTATTAAMDALKKKYPELPIIGVIEPGVRAAIKASKDKNILLLATETTVRSDVYKTLIKKNSLNTQVTSLACGLFVALAEEGCIDDEVAEAVVHKYLSHVRSSQYDCILLGCTHFPVLKKMIAQYVNTKVQVVDSAIETATEVEQKLMDLKLLTVESRKELQFLVTDLPERFMRVGELFLNGVIDINNVNLVNANS